ncbi:sulfite exporter TauE/SafE family protein [uncultured Litoreibacter sp.]|uniref:sulfite exporter TauE/SafE family protein n=1 Tax=uncultured Litoreibacter sp. TaxID=1392394 RepID=UPI00262B6353|nr:sulfite exporter TauE/SafE family protein [uncultured Litoreibacter sp.]
MNLLADLTNLTTTEVLLLSAIIFVASMVRGFSGFGLSAVVMASAIFILPPLALIPMLWFLEMAGSLAMFKGGMKDADRPTAKGLIIGSACGLPVGLLINMQLATETSKAVALSVLIVLAFGQLAKIRMPFLATTAGTYGSGLGAGIVTGFAGAGGMLIALYMLARNLPARTMRGTLSIYLLGAGVLGLATHLIIGTMDQTAIARGLFFIIPTLLGLYAGRALFIPRLEPYYKPFCLTLLLGLASLGLIRTVSN